MLPFGNLCLACLCIHYFHVRMIFFMIVQCEGKASTHLVLGVSRQVWTQQYDTTMDGDNNDKVTLTVILLSIIGVQETTLE